MPESILEALKELLLAGVALVMSVTGAAGGNAPRVQPAKAEKRQVQVVPRLPANGALTVDEHDNAGDIDDVEDEETEEVDEQGLDVPVSVEFITLRGPIDSRPEGAVAGTWTIAGREVEVTAETHVSTRAANAKAGEWAQVQAELSQAATEADTDQAEQAPLVARSIAVMSSQNMARIVGIIESVDAGAEPAGDASAANDAGKVWIVSGVRIRVTGETHIVGTPEVGRLADVHGGIDTAEPEATAAADTKAGADETVVEEAPDGDLVAKLIVVRGTPNQPKQKQQGRKFDLRGLVEEIDAEAGEWVVAGQTVLVNDDTILIEKKGKAVVGATVRVWAEEDEDGALVATSIEVMRSGQPGKGAGNKAGAPEPKPTKPPKPSQGRGQEKRN